MKPATGQILRAAGLLIEVPCVLGLFFLKQGKLGDWGVGAIQPALVLSIGLGVGFLFWIVGTIVIQWPKPRRRPRPGSPPSSIRRD